MINVVPMLLIIFRICVKKSSRVLSNPYVYLFNKATVYLTFTSNMVSSGLREVFAYLCEKKFVDVIPT